MLNQNNNSIDCNSDFATSTFSNILLKKLSETYSPIYSDIVIVCIGTDKSTGDSLGPLVGYFLDKGLFLNTKNVHIYGTLEKPVHAKNLITYINIIDKKFDNPFVIAIDASLGMYNRVGFISVWDGPLKPGSGVNKELPLVGNIHITGVVNISGFMEFILLQNTRLNIVMKMARIISTSIIYSLSKLNIDNKKLN
ncbi:spore protease YyaC [Senegalia massiliensis]|uniref:Spore protease YyaC n=1 Tax=Senegalia massiliensis TaxID=1720316 RepID=A0A845R6L5_9CLOT|nr:spore protease YyaC [Senegalia massiliensis]NBI08133.1 spore protease YyaC [Senegalia massiliensis]